jgi:glyoxylase-like metal-dependent hydrolase (beta-lactamase superfamily II)
VPPNVTEILPNLVRFTVPFPNDPKRNVNSFLLLGDGEALLLDASWDMPEGLAGLEAALDTVGLAQAAVRTVLITHVHPDHVGLAARLKETGARVGYHPAEAMVMLPRWRRLEEFREHTQLWERLNGAPEGEAMSFAGMDPVAPTLAKVPEPDLPLLGGETIAIGDFRLRPVWTPGHTLGHLCYFEETRKLLFTGDHVLPTITPHVGLYAMSIGNPLPTYLDSLELLNDYHPELVVPAHGEVFADLHARLDELLEHHHERMEELHEIVQDEPLSAWDVAWRARWTRRRVTLEDIAPRHRRLALAETLAHLDMLRAQHRLSKVFEPGKMLYRRVRGEGC